MSRLQSHPKVDSLSLTCLSTARALPAVLVDNNSLQALAVAASPPGPVRSTPFWKPGLIAFQEVLLVVVSQMVTVVIEAVERLRVSRALGVVAFVLLLRAAMHLLHVPVQVCTPCEALGTV